MAVDLQLGGIDARGVMRDRIEQAGGFGANGQLRLGPHGAVAQRDAKLREITRRDGGEFVAFRLLPGELRGAGAGELHAAQVDELAELLGEAVEIELGGGFKLLERAGCVDAEKLRIAVQRVECDVPFSRRTAKFALTG